MDRDYKIERSTEHRAKFRADRPTELGDYLRKKEKKINRSKTVVLPKTIVFGLTNEAKAKKIKKKSKHQQIRNLRSKTL